MVCGIGTSSNSGLEPANCARLGRVRTGRRAPDPRGLCRSFLSGQCKIQVHHLANVVMQVRGALHHHVEAVASLRTCPTVGRGPVLRGLVTDGSQHDIDSLVELLQRLLLRGRRTFGKFARTIAHVARLRDLRPDVVVQVSRDVQKQMAEAVAKWKGLAPELLVGERGGKLVNIASKFRVARCQVGCDCLNKFRHIFFLARDAWIRPPSCLARCARLLRRERLRGIIFPFCFLLSTWAWLACLWDWPSFPWSSASPSCLRPRLSPHRMPSVPSACRRNRPSPGSRSHLSAWLERAGSTLHRQGRQTFLRSQHR